MDQAPAQSSTVDQAASLIESSGAIDALLAGEEAQEETLEESTEADTEQAEAAEPESDELEAEPEGDADDSEEVEAAESEDEGESTESDEEQIELSSLDDLSKALEVSKDELLDNLQAEVVIDGETQTVTLKEALNGYQKDADYRRKTGELAQQRREFEAKAQERTQAQEYQHQIAAHVLSAAKRELLGELQSINFDELKQTDPTAWAAKYAALTERKQQLQQLEQQAHQAYEQSHQQIMQQNQAALQERLAEESRLLAERIPDFEQVKPKIAGYLSNDYGFTTEELSSVADHRLIEMAHKAMLFDQGQAKATKVKPKIKAAPKASQKPAAKAKAVPAKVKAIKASRSKLKKSGHIRDAASAIENLL